MIGFGGKSRKRNDDSENQGSLANLSIILNGIDAMICVTDPETDTLLFINDTMKQVFNVGDDYIGRNCYKVMRGFDSRCEFCPCYLLEMEPDEEIVWEQKDEDTGRAYKSYSKYIYWPDGKKAHLQYSVDITELNDMTAMLDKRLQQQLLMTRISHSYFSGEELNTLLDETLREVAEFMGIAQLLLFKASDDELTIYCQNGWIDEKYKMASRVGGTVTISKELRDIFKSLNNQNKFYVTRDDRGASEAMAQFRVNFHNFLATSIFVYDKLYAILDFAKADDTPWSESEIQMASYTSHILTGVLRKHDMEERLIRAKEAAEQSSRYKTDFLAKMSHEIRTPMNAILGITEIELREGSLSGQVEEGLEKIHEAGTLLMTIINDILDLSRIEAGKMEITPAKYTMPSLINDCIQMVRIRFEDKPLNLTLDIDENTPVNLFGDELRLKQILGNILSNAYKYTDSGDIKVSIAAQDVSDAGTIISFTVADTGQGMTKDQLDILFSEYTRFNMEANRSTIGSGLGLAITKSLVELMDGEISVESEKDKGSVFTVRIPQKKMDEEVFGRETSEKLSSFNYRSTSVECRNQVVREQMPYGSVLIVDDVASNIYVTRGMLLPYGLRIDTAGSGFETIDKIKAGNEYDVIFLDHMMPKMDGIETAKQLRGMGYKKRIIALTANALVGQAEMFLHNGFDGYISKPIDSRELDIVLNEHIRNKQKKPPEQKENKVNASVRPISPEVAGYFRMDAENAIHELEKMYDVLSCADARQIEDYEIIVHGMKSALLNINETDLSHAARELEMAAKEGNTEVMADNTPQFVYSLKMLLEKLG